eukprot:scaffold294925_cov50-Prasinocladus_malaysianus.AAC.1
MQLNPFSNSIVWAVKRYWNTTPLTEGMIVSNEPGYYEDGAFGIRIENLMKVVQADTPFQFGGET